MSDTRNFLFLRGLKLSKRGRNQKENKATWLAFSGLVIAVPASLRETLDLQSRFGELADLNWYVAGPLYLVAASACTFVIWRRCISPCLERRHADELAHLDQAAATIQAPFYTKHAMGEPLLLDMSAAVLAQRASIPMRTAAAIQAHPHIIPRSDLWERLEAAWLLPPGCFRHGMAEDGSKYGDKLTRARIHWYVNRSLVTVVPKPGNFSSFSQDERADWLARFEKIRAMAIKMSQEEI